MNSNFDSKESFLSYKLNIFKELYNDERERRNIASQKISRIIPLIVAMFGGDTYIITKVGEKILNNEGFSSDVRSVTSYILCTVTIISGAILLYFLVKNTIKIWLSAKTQYLSAFSRKQTHQFTTYLLPLNEPWYASFPRYAKIWYSTSVLKQEKLNNS